MAQSWRAVTDNDERYVRCSRRPAASSGPRGRRPRPAAWAGVTVYPGGPGGWAGILPGRGYRGWSAVAKPQRSLGLYARNRANRGNRAKNRARYRVIFFRAHRARLPSWASGSWASGSSETVTAGSPPPGHAGRAPREPQELTASCLEQARRRTLVGQSARPPARAAGMTQRPRVTRAGRRRRRRRLRTSWAPMFFNFSSSAATAVHDHARARGGVEDEQRRRRRQHH